VVALLLIINYLSILPAYTARGPLHGDLGTFLVTGQAMLQHRNPYAVYPTTFHFENGDHLVVAPDLNPPITLYPLELVANAPPLTAYRVWFWISLALYAAGVVALAFSFPSGTTPLRVAWVAVFAGLWETLALGQVYVLLMLLVVGAWLTLPGRRHLLAGVCIGVLVAIKPVFALWPLFLLIAGIWPAALTALGTAAVLTLLPLLISGPGLYREWLTATGAAGSLMTTAGNMSFPALATHAGAAWAGYLLAAVLVAVLAAYVRQRRLDVLRVSTLAIIAALFVGPLTWVGYLLLLLPALWRPWNPLLGVGAVLLAAPWVITNLNGRPSFLAAAFAVPLAVVSLGFLIHGRTDELDRSPAKRQVAETGTASDN
jgi:hypothetical protein